MTSHVRRAYQLLALEPGCTALDARAAWLARARTAHPDVGGNPIEAAALNDAYKLVKQHIEERKETCPACKGEGATYTGKGFHRTKVRCGTCEGEGVV